jgi:hypothetical protein
MSLSLVFRRGTFRTGEPKPERQKEKISLSWIYAWATLSSIKCDSVPLQPPEKVDQAPKTFKVGTYDVRTSVHLL